MRGTVHLLWSTLWWSETYQVYKTSSGEPEAEEDWQEVG